MPKKGYKIPYRDKHSIARLHGGEPSEPSHGDIRAEGTRSWVFNVDMWVEIGDDKTIPAAVTALIESPIDFYGAHYDVFNHTYGWHIWLDPVEHAAVLSAKTGGRPVGYPVRFQSGVRKYELFDGADYHWLGENTPTQQLGP